MSDLERSPELESMAVRESVRKIRDLERTALKEHPLSEKSTFWEADESRFQLYDTVITMNSQKFGRFIALTGMFNFKHERYPTFDVDDIVYLQFCTEQMIRSMFSVADVFIERGCLKIGDCEGKGIDDIKGYCQKMDSVIRGEAFRLRDQGVKAIFSKIHKEMGGDMVTKEDRVGRRVKLLMEVSNAYNTDKNKWKPFLVKLGLIGK